MSRARTGELVAGRYRLVRLLGGGGMGTVHLAHDERLDRPVALKRMHADAGEEIARRFEREARLGAALDHPSLVAVYDVVRADGEVAIAMEFVEGETLADVLARRRPSDDEAVAVVRGLAAALDHAHARGVVHRDVKPGNVLLGPYGPKLADLGISTAAGATRITQAGTLLGTAAYMAPEQLAGGEVGPPADVHALGLVAYELLAGEPARAPGSALELVHRVASEPPPDLRIVRPDAPAAAAEALRRATALDPLDRHVSAGRFAEELEHALAPPARPSQGARPSPPAAAPRRRGPRALVPLAALLVAGTAATAVLWPSGDDDGDAGREGPATPMAGTGEPGPTTADGTAAPATTGDPDLTAARPIGPAETVELFYERGAADDFGGAWALLDGAGQATFGSQAALASTLATLESVAFSRLEPTLHGARATVAFADVASHTGDEPYLDRCEGTIGLTQVAGAWRLSTFDVRCAQDG